jgi:hypothetical protein
MNIDVQKQKYILNYEAWNLREEMENQQSWSLL